MRRLSQDRFHDGADDGRQKSPWLWARQTQGSISRTPVQERRVVPLDHTREPPPPPPLMRLESSNAYGFLHAHGQASTLDVTFRGWGRGWVVLSAVEKALCRITTLPGPYPANWDDRSSGTL